MYSLLYWQVLDNGFILTNVYIAVFVGIVPETHSLGMFSWFPVYFPIRVCNTLLQSEIIPNCFTKAVLYC